MSMPISHFVRVPEQYEPDHKRLAHGECPACSRVALRREQEQECSGGEFFTCSACEWTDYDDRWQVLHDHYKANAEYNG